jgi:hypothetical protein
MAENGEKRHPGSHRTPTQVDRMNHKPGQQEKRRKTNAARAKLEKLGLVKKFDGKDVDHKTMLKDGGSNSISNLRVVPASKNRAWAKKKP